MDPQVGQLQAHYARGQEAGRLDAGLGEVEFVRTTELVLRHLPRVPAVVADIGGGPGRYALWLADLGHRVEHRDLVRDHVEQVAAQQRDGVSTRVGDARRLDLADASVDAVLLLGPLYHLTSVDDRVAALAEAARVVRPGGPVFAAAITRWAPRLHGLLAERLYESHPAMTAVVEEVEATGVLQPLFDGAFCGWTHRPEELADEVRAAGLELVDVLGVEGVAFALDDLEARLADPAGRAAVLDSARALERVPELLGLSPHLLATARRPT